MGNYFVVVIFGSFSNLLLCLFIALFSSLPVYKTRKKKCSPMVFSCFPSCGGGGIRIRRGEMYRKVLKKRKKNIAHFYTQQMLVNSLLKISQCLYELPYCYELHGDTKAEDPNSIYWGVIQRCKPKSQPKVKTQVNNPNKVKVTQGKSREHAKTKTRGETRHKASALQSNRHTRHCEEWVKQAFIDRANKQKQLWTISDTETRQRMKSNTEWQ